MIVLDTNVLSELMRPSPADAVVRWVSREPMRSYFTTTVSQAEIVHGVLLLPPGRRRDRLEALARVMFDEEFAGRVLAFGTDAALMYARIAADRSRAGRPISQFDAQIAAIARSAGASLATRNVRDFEDCGIDVIDPWSAR